MFRVQRYQTGGSADKGTVPGLLALEVQTRVHDPRAQGLHLRPYDQK